MIVEPDFLTHWKTQFLIGELDDKAAPLYVIALWAHCQQRRTSTFPDLSAKALRAVCRYEGDGEVLKQALISSGFLDEDPNGITVHGWSEVNAKLLAQWENGRNGGRPSKPKNNPTETQAKPNDNPTADWDTLGLTHKEPIEKSREEKSREDENKKVAANESQPPSSKRMKLADDQFLNSLSDNPAYTGIDVRREHAKMVVWCQSNNKNPTQRRLVNWLNNAERPMNVQHGITHKPAKPSV